MTYNFTHIDKDLHRNLTLRLSAADYSGYNSMRISEMPTALSNILENYHKDNIKTFEYNSAMYYNGYLRESETTSLFPSIANFAYAVKPTFEYLENLRSEYSFTFDKSTFSQKYPIAVRYTNGTNLWLIERPPFQAKITYRSTRSSYNGNSKEYDIWMPWTAMLLNMNPKSSFYHAALFFNDGPINSLDDLAIPCFFPNMYHNGDMCLNQTSIMLQQHLSATDCFDVNTIYNFIINDYMTGGWNLDLSIQVFDHIKAYAPGQTIKNAYQIITHGIQGNKKYPSCVSPVTGRISIKKYISNFLNYFSHADSNEVISIIAEAKDAQLRSTSNYKRFSTYSSLIENLESNKTINNNIFSAKFFNSKSVVSNSLNGFIDPSFDIINASHETIKELSFNITQFLDQKFNDQIQKIISLDSFSLPVNLISFEKENSYIYIKDINNILDISEEDFSSEQFYLDMMLNEKVLV